MRGHQPDILLDRSPGQQPRLLKHHAEPRAGRPRHAAPKIMVEAGENLEHGALAAAGRADEIANLSGAERKADTGEHVLPLARLLLKRLAFDIDLKLHGAATGINGLQRAAPAQSR